MGEIKSTLDLIMEKTKNLTMSAEEKEEVRRQEWLKKARGWIQKFLDDQIDMDKVKNELLGKDYPLGWEKILQEELITGLEPEGENEKRFQLIKELLGIPEDRFRKVQEDFHQRLAREGDKRTALLKDQLSKQGVSGSAVIPNLARDPSWKRFYDQEKQASKERWQAFINN